MKNTLLSLICAVALLVIAPPLSGQINPATQIKWPMVTGTTAPTIPCTPTNYGQPYTNTAATGSQVAFYACTANGWISSQGPTGPAGPAGPPATFSGVYNPASSYPEGALVSFTSGGTTSSYVSLVNNNQGNSPATSPLDWALFAQGASATPGGANLSVQVNANGSIGGSSASTDSTFTQFTFPFVFSPSTWEAQTPLQNWFSTLAQSGGSPVTGVFIGDSITAGVPAPGAYPITDTWAYQVRQKIQATYGGTGNGIVPLGFGSTGSASALRPEWTQTGTWNTAADLGPSQTGTGAFQAIYYATGTGNVMTIAGQSGNVVGIFGEENTTSGGGCNVTIDGTNEGTIFNATAPSPEAVSHTFSVASGSHTIAISPAVSGASCFLYGAGAWSTTGVRMDNIGVGYMRSGAYVTSSQLAFLNLISPAPSIATIDLGVNDASDGVPVTQAQYQANMQALITYLKSVNPYISILIVDNYDITNSFPSDPLTQAMVRQTEQYLAAVNSGVQYMSLHDIFQSVANANAVGGNLLYSDDVHPSEAGANAIADVLVKEIANTASGSAGAQFPSSVSSADQSFALGEPTTTVGAIVPGLNFSFVPTIAGSANGVTQATFATSVYGNLFYMPNQYTGGWRFGTYTGGTPLTNNVSQITAYHQLASPTGVDQIPTIPTSNSVLSVPASATTIDTGAVVYSGVEAVNALVPGLLLNTSANAGTSSGWFQGQFASGVYTNYIAQPNGYTLPAYCTYAFETTITSLTQLNCSYFATLASTNAWTGVNSFSVSPTVPTVTAGDSSTKVASTAFVATALPAALPIAATSGSIGGSALVANACSVGTTTVTGSTTAMTVDVTPVTDPNASTVQDYTWYGYVSTNGTVTVKLCALTAGTPTATAFNIRVIR